MPKRSLADQLDQAVQALLSQPDSLLPSAEAELAPLVSLAAAATSVYAPMDQPYGDREGGVKDKFGNLWYIATPISWTPPAGGPPAVQPSLHPRGADQLIQFLKDAFDAEILGDVPRSPEG